MTIRLPVFERAGLAAMLAWLAPRVEGAGHSFVASVCMLFAIVFFVAACATAVEKPKEK